MSKAWKEHWVHSLELMEVYEVACRIWNLREENLVCQVLEKQEWMIVFATTWILMTHNIFPKCHWVEYPDLNWWLFMPKGDNFMVQLALGSEKKVN